MMTTPPDSSPRERLFYPCVFHCKTASISKRVSALPMSHFDAVTFLKTHYRTEWLKGDAIPQPINHPSFVGMSRLSPPLSA